MTFYDVVIIGGGPAGSTCAWALQRAGLKTLVLDKSQFPRDKVCAGWVTPNVISNLELNLEEYRQYHTLQEFRSFRTGLFQSSMVTTDYGETVSYGILRREFDNYLLRRSGAELQLGEGLKSLENHQGEWVINNSLKTPLLIGAGGHFCPVARKLNPQKHDDTEVVFAQEFEIELDDEQQAQCDVQADRPELYFLPELDGYGWSVRKGNYLNVGLGRTDNHNLSKYVTRFHRFLEEEGKVPVNTSKHFHGHAYRLASRYKRRKLVDAGVMLIGDAAGLAYSKSGEGIYTAVTSGLMAAETILAANKNYNAVNLSNYLAKLEGFLGDEYMESETPMLDNIKRFFAPPLFKSRYFSRHFLLDKWFLHQ